MSLAAVIFRLEFVMVYSPVSRRPQPRETEMSYSETWSEVYHHFMKQISSELGALSHARAMFGNISCRKPSRHVRNISLGTEPRTFMPFEGDVEGSTRHSASHDQDGRFSSSDHSSSGPIGCFSLTRMRSLVGA